MKRKNWRVNSEHGVVGSKSRLNDAASPGTQGIGCERRVRYRDLDSCKLKESASVPQERFQDPKSDEPKTSEYAFFKKLKEDVHRSHSNPLHQDKSQFINLKASRYSRERSNIDNNHKDLKFSLPKNVTPHNLFPCISPPHNASHQPVVDMKIAGTTSTGHNMQENVEQYGAPCKNGGIFSRKRHKLHELVAKTLSLEVDELFSEGHDIVSVLLSKLFPESNGNKSFARLKTGTLDIDTKSKSRASKEFDVRINESQWAPARNYMELCGKSLDIGFSSCWSEIPRTKELPNPNFPNCYSHGTFLKNRVMELSYERAPPILFTEGDSALDLDIKKHKRLMSRHLKELDQFHYSIKSLHGQESPTLLLGWDVDNIVDKSNLSTLPQNTELSLHPFLSSLYGDDRQKNLNDFFNANEFHHPIKTLNGRETQNLLLDWDVEDMADKSNLSTASQNTELSFNCFLSSLHTDDQEKNLDDSFVESRLCTESLVYYNPPTSENTELSWNCSLSSSHIGDRRKNFDDSFAESRLCTESLNSYHPSNLLSLQFSSSASNKSHDNVDIFADNSFSSCLPDMTNRLNVNKSSNYGITCSGSNISLSPLNQLWFMRKILNKRQQHCLDKETLSSAGFDLYMEPTCKPVNGSSIDHCLCACHALECLQSDHLSSYLIGDANDNFRSSHRGISNHLCEDMIHFGNWSSNYFQIALDKEKSYPLLLDKSHWDESYGEKYCDDEVKF